MFTQNLALISQSRQVSFDDTAQIAAAIQKQLTRDFAPIWRIQATISAYASLDHVPVGYWNIVIRDDIGDPRAAGYHQDEFGQPYALVDADMEVPIVCSHEALEMLVDPFGDRQVASDSIVAGQGRALYLVEVCDPSEAREFGYDVNGIRLSDFYTPAYFDPVFSAGVQYSFTGAIKRPKEVLKDGYLSWFEPVSRQWWQASFFGAALQTGPINVKRDPGQSWREAIDAASFDARIKAAVASLQKAGIAASATRSGGARAGICKASHLSASKVQADELNQRIQGVVALARSDRRKDS